MFELIVSPVAQPLTHAEMQSIEDALHSLGIATLAGYTLPLEPEHAARVLAKAMRVLGGPGSGNFGHAGRPGAVGGSASGGLRLDKDGYTESGEPGPAFARRGGALWEHRATGHLDLNAKLREGLPLSDDDRRSMRVLDDLMEPLPADITVYRNMPEVSDDIFTDRGYVSTSLDPGIGTFRQGDPTRIDVPKGTLAIRIGDYYKDDPEQEVLISRHSRFKKVGPGHLKVVSLRGLGGAGSGNFGHAGRPGEVGGSAAAAGFANVLKQINEPDGGFTYQPATGQVPTTGYALSLHKDRERILPAEQVNLVTLAQYAKDNEDLLSSANNYLGGWHNPQDGKVYLDVSTVVDSAEEAERLALEAYQIAYYDLGLGTSVNVQKEKKRAAEESFVESYRAALRSSDAQRFDRTRQATHGSGADAGGDRGSEEDLRELGGPGSGNFGHAGRPGQVGGSSTATQVSVTQSLKSLGLDHVYVENHPTAIDGAVIAAEVMSEMKAKGYEMPKRVAVFRQSGNPRGSVTWHEGTVMELNVPMNLPEGINLDEATAAAFGGQEGKFVARTMRDVVIHEMGHVNRRPVIHGETAEAAREFSAEIAALKHARFTKAANSVSAYANTNPDEFIAEAFTLLYNGKSLPEATMKVYEALRGPKIR